METVTIRNYSAGTAEVWIDRKHVCNIGTTRVFHGKYGSDYAREMTLLAKLGALLGFHVKRLNYEENKEYEGNILKG